MTADDLRNTAALDLLRASSALFGRAPAADRSEKRWDQAVELSARTFPHIPYFYVVGVAMSMLTLQVAAAVLTAAFYQLASMAALPGVVGIKPVLIYKPVNAVSVPFIGTPAVWGGSPAFRGEHIKLAIVDSGADYTHANFGGPGTVAAFDDAFANSTKPADPALFGPNAPKVKGGTDLVGDNYDASDPK